MQTYTLMTRVHYHEYETHAGGREGHTRYRPHPPHLPLSGPHHKLARSLSGEHSRWAVENTVAQRYRLAVIAKEEVAQRQKNIFLNEAHCKYLCVSRGIAVAQFSTTV